MHLWCWNRGICCDPQETQPSATYCGCCAVTHSKAVKRDDVCHLVGFARHYNNVRSERDWLVVLWVHEDGSVSVVDRADKIKRYRLEELALNGAPNHITVQ